MLASLLFPYDSDAPDLIDGWMAELDREKCIVLYEVESARYLQIVNWLEHQKIDKPSRSKFPTFDESSRIFANTPRTFVVGPRTKDQGDDQGTIPCRASSTDKEESPQSISVETLKPARKETSRDRKKHSADPRHIACKGWLEKYWNHFNPQDQMPWDGAEGKALGMLLGASPALTPERFHEMLRNRGKSEGVVHSERPSLWLRKIHNYANGPIDRFGKPLQVGISGKEDRNLTAFKAAISATRARRGDNSCAYEDGDFTERDDNPNVLTGRGGKIIEATTPPSPAGA